MVCPSLHKYEYGKLPPVTVTVAVPSLPPLQETEFKIEAETDNSLGSLTVIFPFSVQLLSSVIVTE